MRARIEGGQGERVGFFAGVSCRGPLYWILTHHDAQAAINRPGSAKGEMQHYSQLTFQLGKGGGLEASVLLLASHFVFLFFIFLGGGRGSEALRGSETMTRAWGAYLISINQK